MLEKIAMSFYEKVLAWGAQGERFFKDDIPLSENGGDFSLYR